MTPDRSQTDQSIGPLQLVLVGFHGDVLQTDLIDELLTASAIGSIRLVDLLVAEKDENGVLWTSELSDPNFLEEIRYGALICALIDQGAGFTQGAPAGLGISAETVAANHSVLGLAPAEVNDLVHSLPRGHSAVLALIEHVWARDLHQATLAAGGVVLGQALIAPEGLIPLGAEVAAALETVARVEAAEVNALSEAIAREGARRAVDALVAAEVIEADAMEEAVEVVSAALAFDSGEAAGEA